MTKVTKLEAFCRMAEATRFGVDAGLLIPSCGYEFNSEDMTALAAEIRELQRKAAADVPIKEGDRVSIVLEDVSIKTAHADQTYGAYTFGVAPVHVTGRLLRVKKPDAPAQDAGGWVEWKGGECPVDPNCLVEVMFNVPGGDAVPGLSPGRAGALAWTHWGSTSDIVAYRVIG